MSTLSRRNTTHSWDVAAAEKDYIGRRDLSYEDIASRYGVSKTTVERYAKQREWSKRRRNATEQGLFLFEQRQKETIAEVNERHLNNYLAVQQAAEIVLLRAAEDETSSSRELLIAAQVLKLGIEGERLARGLPNVISKTEPVNDKPRISSADLTQKLNRMVTRRQRLKLMQSGMSAQEAFEKVPNEISVTT